MRRSEAFWQRNQSKQNASFLHALLLLFSLNYYICTKTSALYIKKIWDNRITNITATISKIQMPHQAKGKKIHWSLSPAQKCFSSPFPLSFFTPSSRPPPFPQSLALSFFFLSPSLTLSLSLFPSLSLSPSLWPGWLSDCMNNVLPFVMKGGKGGKRTLECWSPAPMHWHWKWMTAYLHANLHQTDTGLTAQPILLHTVADVSHVRPLPPPSSSPLPVFPTPGCWCLPVSMGNTAIRCRAPNTRNLQEERIDICGRVTVVQLV